MEYKTHGANNNQHKSKPFPPYKKMDGLVEIFRDLFWGPKKKYCIPRVLRLLLWTSSDATCLYFVCIQSSLFSLPVPPMI